MDGIRKLGFVLKDVSRLWVRYFEQQAGELGMTLTQAKVLVFLSRNEGTTQARLAELCDTDPMTLVRVLDRMERDDWLERRPDPNDRRAYRLYLRPAADPVLAEMNRIADRTRDEILSGLPNGERLQLLSSLERIHATLLTLVPANGEPARTGNTSSHSAVRRRPMPRARSTRRRKASS